MEDKYLKIHHDSLNKQRNDEVGIEMLHEWGVNKSKLEK